MNLQVLESQFWSLCLQGVALGFIYVLISLGYTMVYGVLRLINFANSEVFMVGTFATVVAQVGILQNQTDSQPLHGFKLIYTLLFALVFSMLILSLIHISEPTRLM
jgi:branched-chain amino acid transport system permease protein